MESSISVLRQKIAGLAVRRTAWERISLLVAVIVGLGGIFVWPRPPAYPDTAFFGGDTWEYQSMAVNVSRGHGLVFGAVEPFAMYRFDAQATAQPYYTEFLRFGEKGGWRRFYRTPGYPLFLGAIYSAVGVHPATAMRVQWILLWSSACALLWIATLLWSGKGFAAALLAALPIYTEWLPLAGSILTESLIVSALIVWTATTALALRQRRLPGGLVIGAVSGLVALVKGSMIFLAPLLVGTLLLRERVTGEKFRSFCAAIVAGLAVVLGCYSVYASKAAGHFVLLSEQGGEILLDGNNEHAARTGAWAPEWRRDAQAFFNQPGQQGRSATRRVAAYYAGHPATLLPTLARKWCAAYGESRTAQVATILALATLAWLLARRRLREFVLLLGSPLVIISLNFLCITLLFFGEPRFVRVGFWCFTLGLSLALVELTRGFLARALPTKNPAD